MSSVLKNSYESQFNTHRIKNVEVTGIKTGAD